jgi:hypothetical protein
MGINAGLLDDFAAPAGRADFKWAPASRPINRHGLSFPGRRREYALKERHEGVDDGRGDRRA